MAITNVGFKGVDVKQTQGGILPFLELLHDTNGNLVTSGTTNLRIYEVEIDTGTGAMSLKSYDFADNTFKTTALTTENLAMTYMKGNAGGTDTGLWGAALLTLTGFTVGALYVSEVVNNSAAPATVGRLWQFGGDQGDLAVTAGAGVSYAQADVERWLAAQPPASAVAGMVVTDLYDNRGVPVNLAGTIPVSIAQVNGFTIKGNGQPGNEWGPA